MDINCPICGEPWDIYELHDVPGMSFKAAYAAFQKKGCGVFKCSHSDTKDEEKATKARILYDLLGDDVDGVASILSE